jgi:hypothetical protein
MTNAPSAPAPDKAAPPLGHSLRLTWGTVALLLSLRAMLARHARRQRPHRMTP